MPLPSSHCDSLEKLPKPSFEVNCNDYNKNDGVPE